MKPDRIPKSKKLPDLPSALLRLAMSDLEKVEADPRYTVHMNEWHSLYPHGESKEMICHVCLAGSVMAKTLEIPINTSDGTNYFDLENRFADWRKLTMLDSFRLGKVEEGLDWVDKELPDGFPRRIDVTSYVAGPKKFKKDMEKIATMLEGAGL